MKYSFLLVGPGWWVRGQEVADAARRAYEDHAVARSERCVLLMIVGDDKPMVNGVGAICYLEKAQRITVGYFSVGQLMRSRQMSDKFRMRTTDEAPGTKLEKDDISEKGVS